jgi:hypothetical protein
MFCNTKSKIKNVVGSVLHNCVHLSCDLTAYSKSSVLKVTSSRPLQPSADAGSLLADFSTLKVEVIRSSETSVHTRSTGATPQKMTLFKSYSV